jgi:hypothetical protein
MCSLILADNSENAITFFEQLKEAYGTELYVNSSS